MIGAHVSRWSVGKKIAALLLAILLIDFSIPDGCDCGPNEIVSIR